MILARLFAQYHLLMLKCFSQIDFRICLWAWVMFLALDFHRRNINRAISDNMVNKPHPNASRSPINDIV